MPHLSREKKIQLKLGLLRLLFFLQLFSPSICTVRAYGQLTLFPILNRGIWYLELISEITEFKDSHFMGEKTKVKWLSEGTGLIHDSTSFTCRALSIHSQIMPESLSIVKIIWRKKKNQLNLREHKATLIKLLFSFKTDLLIFRPQLDSTTSSELLCPSPWMKLSWVSENASNCLMSGRKDYRMWNCLSVIWGGGR